MEYEDNKTWTENDVNLSDFSSVNGSNGSHLDCGTFVVHYKIVPSVICSFIFIFGILYCFFGYRLFKATMFVTGFLFGLCLVYFVCIEENVLPLSGKIGVSVAAGLICGLLAMFLLYIGLFMTGFQCGLLIALFFFVLLEFLYHPFSKWIPIGVLISAGLLFAVLVLYWQKGLLILGTSLLGSGLVLVSVDYFLDVFRMTRYCFDRLTAKTSTVSLCWFSWLLFAIWPALTLLSIVIQWHYTAKNYSHKCSGVQKKTLNQRRKRGSDAESEQHHYRHLYQIRRVNGDVISKNYFKSIEENRQLSPSLQPLSHSTNKENIPIVQLAEDNVATTAEETVAITTEDVVAVTTEDTVDMTTPDELVPMTAEDSVVMTSVADEADTHT